jgi:hypothetical protein
MAMSLGVLLHLIGISRGIFGREVLLKSGMRLMRLGTIGNFAGKILVRIVEIANMEMYVKVGAWECQHL